MASTLIIAQQFFSQLQKNNLQSNDPPPNQCTNCTPEIQPGHLSDDQQLPLTSSQAPEAAARLASAALRSLSSSEGTTRSLVDLIYSSSVLRDWSIFFVYGGVLEMLRRLVFYIYRWGFNSFFVTATFRDDDPTYSWVCFWLSRQPAWRIARDLEVSAKTFKFGFKSNDSEEHVRGVSFLPSAGSVYTMWYKGHWMRVIRYLKRPPNELHRYHIQLCILSYSHKVLENLIIDSKKAWEDAQRKLVHVYVPKGSSWKLLATRSKRSLSSIILDPGMKNILIEDATDFLSCKAWYAARGIPFRRGYLLYGAPGTGKTSIIHSLAGELKLDLYVICLSEIGMDDAALTQLITRLPQKCIALMEDIDAAFSHTINRETNNSKKDGDKDKDKDKDKEKEPSMFAQAPRTSGITLSGLLNALDGVGAQEGRILFATTNKYHSLDPALCRPGRMDMHLEFKLASRYQARELFKRFYMPNSELEKEDGHSFGSEKRDKGDSRPNDTVSDTKTNGSDGVSYREGHAGRHSMRALSPDELEKLAEDFGDAIPVGEFSMASLQGYLMGYKVNPETAVREAASWVTKEREGRDGVMALSHTRGSRPAARRTRKLRRIKGVN